MKQFLSLIVVSLLLAGCSTAAPTANNQPLPTEIPKKSSFQSLKNLLSSGLAQQCTWKVTENGKNMTGTILINGQKFKQTVVVPSEKGNSTTTIISDNVNFYSWSDASKGVGIKMNLAEAQKNVPTSGQKTEGSVNWDKEYNYDCVPATVSEADFALPTDITFTDLSETLKGLQNQFKNLIPTQ